MSVSGVELAGRYYKDVVAPLLEAESPGLPHAAVRLGSGSDVLLLDDDMSRDHDWGLRLALLVDRSEVKWLDDFLERSLPGTFAGRPTRFATTWDAAVRHRVEVDTPEGFATSRLGLAVDRGLEPLDWLSLTGQAILEIAAGDVYCDTHGGITDIRRRLNWYPDDVWRYVVATDWRRLDQGLPLIGRTGARGDDIGSRVVAARLAAVAMHLGCLLERRWPPYPKWLGMAFSALPSASSAAPALRAALTAASWEDRQNALCEALRCLHNLQRSVGLPTGKDLIEPFFDRPFLGISADVVERLTGSITDLRIRRLPAGVGSLEQWVDNVTVLMSPSMRAAAASTWRSALPTEEPGGKDIGR